MSLTLTSRVFEQGKPIPAVYTCDDRDISPPLAWTEPPEGTKSLTLISDDPDAPMKTWVHWVIYNIPATKRELPENMPTDEKLLDGSMQGMTDFGRVGYGGPCPPSGVHRYYFKLYALDTTLTLPPKATKTQLLKAMEGHIVGQAELMGTYQRSR